MYEFLSLIRALLFIKRIYSYISICIFNFETHSVCSLKDYSLYLASVFFPFPWLLIFFFFLIFFSFLLKYNQHAVLYKFKEFCKMTTQCCSFSVSFFSFFSSCMIPQIRIPKNQSLNLCSLLTHSNITFQALNSICVSSVDNI